MLKNIATVSVLLLAVMFLGCGQSKKQEAAKRQETSIAEMQRVQAAFGDLQIAINAGVSTQEFSQRTNDTLVKIGDLQHSEVQAETGFPMAKDKVGEIYAHFHSAAEIYVLSKPLLEPNLDWDDEIMQDIMRDSEWKIIQDRFPDRVESGYFVHSDRRKNAIALWGLAEEDTKASGGLIDHLSNPTS